MTFPSKDSKQTDPILFGLGDSLQPSKNARLWIGGHNTILRGQLDQELKSNPRPPTGPIDWAIITPQTPDEALYFTTKVKPRMTSRGTIWIVSRQTDRRSPDSGSISEGLAIQLDDLGLVLLNDPPSANPGVFEVLRLQVR